MKQKKRKKPPYVLLGILFALIAGVAYVGITQWNNVQALLALGQHTTQELEHLVAENETKTVEILKSLPGPSLRPLTVEENDKVAKGELTEEEVVALILSSPPSEPVSVAPTTTEPTIAESTTAEPNTVKPTAAVENSESAGNEEEERIAELVAQVYVLRATMIGQLDSLLNTAKAEYLALSEAERTNAKKSELAAKYMSLATRLENTCDSQIEAILKDLEVYLNETESDTGAVAEIRKAYKEEKYLKKSYLLSQYSQIGG